MAYRDETRRLERRLRQLDAERAAIEKRLVVARLGPPRSRWSPEKQLVAAIVVGVIALLGIGLMLATAMRHPSTSSDAR